MWSQRTLLIYIYCTNQHKSQDSLAEDIGPKPQSCGGPVGGREREGEVGDPRPRQHNQEGAGQFKVQELLVGESFSYANPQHPWRDNWEHSHVGQYGV